MNEPRRAELLAWLKRYRGAVEEVAFFTGFTHPPLPLKTIEERADVLKRIIPQFRALGLCAGINHLATLGHLDENLENSLSEPWQHLTDISGSVSKSCYCSSDPRFLDYLRQAYVALAEARPEFIWVDDDVRMESHPAGVSQGCFCDLCVEKFSAETGRPWTREGLKAALSTGTRAARLALRRQWLEHNRTYIADLLSGIRDAVDSVDPGIKLGLMTGEISYSGYGFARWAESLTGKRGVEVKWRPGGGFYTDDQPAALLGKAHSIGRQVGLLPAPVVDVQSEHENFPYQRLKKSDRVFQTEIAAYIGAGCTGTALNCMGITPDPFDEYRPYFDGVNKHRRFFDKAVGTFGRSPCEGLWPVFTPDHVMIHQAEQGEWMTSGAWGGDMAIFNEWAEIGLPMSYTRQGAHIALLSGDSCLQFSKPDLIRLLSGSVMMDGAALERLNEMGLSDHTGFTVLNRKDRDTTEVLTKDPVNGKFAGWQRDCRPSFWPDPGYLLKPLFPGSRVIGETIDFTPVNHGPSSGVFENELGGRVAVVGYYPWKSVHSLAKSSQVRSLCRWLGRSRVPAYVGSYHKAALWCRRDGAGAPAILLVNASLDAVDGMRLLVRDVGTMLTLTRMDATTQRLTSPRLDPPYAVFELPRLSPWEAVLVARR